MTVRQLAKDSIVSELNSLEALLGRLADDDIVHRISLSKRAQGLRAELECLEEELRPNAAVVLSFDGGPVEGSRAIDAEFATSVLHDYQELIAKQLARVETGGLARTGPVPVRDLSRLNITNIVHGSFGFQLEEKGSDQSSLIDSSTKIAITKVDTMLSALASRDIVTYDETIASIDRRLFLTVQKFYESMHRVSASLKIIEDDRAIIIDHATVNLVRERIHGVQVRDKDITITGELLGISPVQRKFDLRTDGAALVISGQVHPNLSDEYLRRLHGDQIQPGQNYRAHLTRRTAVRPDGTERVSYTLTGLNSPTRLKLASTKKLT